MQRDTSGAPQIYWLHLRSVHQSVYWMQLPPCSPNPVGLDARGSSLMDGQHSHHSHVQTLSPEREGQPIALKESRCTCLQNEKQKHRRDRSTGGQRWATSINREVFQWLDCREGQDREVKPLRFIEDRDRTPQSLEAAGGGADGVSRWLMKSPVMSREIWGWGEGGSHLQEIYQLRPSLTSTLNNLITSVHMCLHPDLHLISVSLGGNKLQ